MASLIDMRRRIRAVKNTQQITKAMKMVAASKLRRAQERIVATRPFAAQAKHVLASISARVDQSTHPLHVQRPGVKTGSTLLIVITSDRALCGSFNTNIVKAGRQVLGGNPRRQVQAARKRVEAGLDIPQEKWFTNLVEKGNTGSASPYIMLDELFKSGRIQKGQRLLMYIPESGRFSSGFIYMEAV